MREEFCQQAILCHSSVALVLAISSSVVHIVNDLNLTVMLTLLLFRFQSAGMVLELEERFHRFQMSCH